MLSFFSNAADTKPCEKMAQVFASFGVFLLWVFSAAGEFHIWSVMVPMMVPMMVATAGNGMVVGNASACAIKYFRLRAGTAVALQGLTQFGAMALAVSAIGKKLTDGGYAVLAMTHIMMVGFLLVWAGVIGVTLIESYRPRLRQY
ncbi:MAG: hypothetical protein ORN57_03040 [Alphaproteobacteria bacterium]|nr:hypothetical protein [Alphaproteobacteria bacterium]